MGSLEGRTALVTGGSRGLGREVAGGLGRAGATVVLAARDPDRLARTVGGLVEQGLDVTGVAVDVSDPAAVRALPHRLGPLAAVDILVNAAGEDAPRSAAQGAETAVWLACREQGPTGLLWEDRAVVPW